MNTTTRGAMARDDWWRSAVIYQIYPRSFADASGDGVGDLPGITRRLPALAELGVDAVWLSPFFTSPQADAGYDVADYCDVDPLFGTLADFDAMLANAHDLGMRVIVDLVPNHSSIAHAWFRAALAAPPGSTQRARYIFRDGLGENGELPPNNWESVFGGRAWTRVTEADGTPGQWYLHIFDSSQPDFDWTNNEVQELFRGVLRFWLDRGVDGFRVDVAHGLAKAAGLPDYTPPEDSGSMGGDEADVPYWAQEGVHPIYRDWHEVLAAYGPDRILAGEAWVEPLTKLAKWVRPDEMHQTFNFSYLETPWAADRLRSVVDESLAAFGSVGAPSTWVLSNHDVIRHATRLALTPPPPQGQGLGPASTLHPDAVLGLRRARAATSFMLALPGSSYLYQGEELGLPEVIDLPDSARQDPSFFRTAGKMYGRDGCRVPIPWEASAPATGFSPTGSSWLPQPDGWADYARDAQAGVPGSTLELYRSALTARREHALGDGELSWLPSSDEAVLAFRNGEVTVVANTGSAPVPMPVGRVIVASGPVSEGELPADTTVWLLDA
ncbi:glycoside hydrolase family 13 protein [Homoserinibacter sp. GY 40078]|uniref:glycoside hydrolase family 13 protein n=1 Tax=Homoserinibacter sp. GY 40078 TaxID=2603275 RepID=UPI0011C84A17|nr:glycoside hydrolase family 13 protein [Homoserinibacter sp. GY 40078]TXK18549.1 glycoside hydrolase family 13 protein [Homoserinibacter sp. GY 40078]